MKPSGRSSNTAGVRSRRDFIIIAVLALAAFAPTLRVGFLWDDHVIIENNPWIQTWSWTNLKHDFSSDNTQNVGDNYYRPFQAFSHRVDYSIWKLNPFGYHLDDVLVHIANGLLLYLLVIALGFPSMVALLTASLFVVNPIGIEQFIIPSGRTTPLSFFFALACILSLLRHDLGTILLGYLSFVLALFTKEFSVVIPALVGLVFFATRASPRRWTLLAPMLLLLGPYMVLRQRAVHSMVSLTEPSMFIFFLFKVFPKIVVHYVMLILWPWNLHSHRLINRLSHVWYLYLAGWVGLLGWSWRQKDRTSLFCIGWIVLGLLPTIPVMMNGSFMLDHWGYPISLGVLLPVALLLSKGIAMPNLAVRRLAFSLFFILLIFWSLLAHLNVALRGTDEKMYRWALNFTSSNPIKYNLGVLLLNSNRPAEALPFLFDFHEAYPDDPHGNAALDEALRRTGHRPHFQRSPKQPQKES